MTTIDVNGAFHEYLFKQKIEFFIVEKTRLDELKKIHQPLHLSVKDSDSIYRIQDKLIKPYIKGHIDSHTFIQGAERLNEQQMCSLTHHFTLHKYSILKTDDLVYNKLIELDGKCGNHSTLKMMLAQRIEELQEVENIESVMEEARKEHRVGYGFFISRYALLNQHEKTFRLLEKAVDELELNNRLYSDYWFLSGFEYLMLQDDSKLENRTRQLLYIYLDKANMDVIETKWNILKYDRSQVFKNVVERKLISVESETNVEEKAEKQKIFNRTYLKYYINCFGVDSIDYLKKLTSVQIEYDNNGVNFKITDDERSRIGIAFHSLEFYLEHNNSTLTSAERKEILNFVLSSNIQNASNYGEGWIYLDRIINLLYPQSSYKEYESFFQYVKLSSRFNPEKEWGKNKPFDIISFYSSVENILKELGLIQQISTLDKIAKYKLEEDSRWSNKEKLIKEALERNKIGIHYDCEAGFVPVQYEYLMSQYLDIAKKELENFQPYLSYDYDTDKERGEVKYTLMLADNEIGYLFHPRDYGDWYDAERVEGFINMVLQARKSTKRFVPTVTGDQTWSSIFGDPNLVGKLCSQFNIDMIHEPFEVD